MAGLKPDLGILKRISFSYYNTHWNIIEPDFWVQDEIFHKKQRMEMSLGIKNTLHQQIQNKPRFLPPTGKIFTKLIQNQVYENLT